MIHLSIIAYHYSFNIIIARMNSNSASPARLPINMLQNSYTYSINPQYSNSLQPYNFHNLSGSNSPQQYNDQSSPRREQIPNQNINISNNNSFARNFKGRLYGFDPSQEEAKQLKLQRYREQLLEQAEEQRRRKLEEKAKADAQDAKREKDFNDNVRIQAQKKGLKKEEPSYFMMRTVKGKLNKSVNLSNSRGKEAEAQESFELGLKSNSKQNLAEQFSRKDNLKRTLYQNPKIIKRGGYHNQSSLDHQQPPPNPESNQIKEVKQPQEKHHKKSRHSKKQAQQVRLSDDIQYEQQRIHQILMFQEHMLKKLDYFKKDVLSTSRSLHLDEQLEKVRFKLRAKPLNMPKVYSLNAREGIDNVIENGSFYHLPLISANQKIYQGSRETKKRKDKDKLLDDIQQSNQEQKEVVHLQDRRNMLNDKNISPSNPEQAQQPDQEP